MRLVARRITILMLLNVTLLPACDPAAIWIKTHPDPDVRIEEMRKHICTLKTQEEAEKTKKKDNLQQTGLDRCTN